MRFVSGFLFAVLLAVVLGLLAVYGGWYNVSAASGHSAFMRWLLSTTMDNSVRARAGPVDLPRPTPQQVASGAAHFQEHCVQCHGAPGVKPDGWSRSLVPQPPDLGESASEWTPAQIHWIVANGVKMSGMPAWGSHMDRNELNDVVAFVKALPTVSPQQYQQMVQAEGARVQHQESGGTR